MLALHVASHAVRRVSHLALDVAWRLKCAAVGKLQALLTSEAVRSPLTWTL
jgi:hypothetical protein